MLLDDDVVYAKTHFGHREILFGEHDLTMLERRFLMVVNGNTPLQALLTDSICAATFIPRSVDCSLSG